MWHHRARVPCTVIFLRGWRTWHPPCIGPSTYVLKLLGKLCVDIVDVSAWVPRKCKLSDAIEDQGLLAVHVLLESRGQLLDTSLVLGIEWLVSVTEEVGADIIHEYTMGGGCHVLVREAQVDGVLPEDEDDGTLQYGLNVGFVDLLRICWLATRLLRLGGLLAGRLA